MVHCVLICIVKFPPTSRQILLQEHHARVIANEHDKALAAQSELQASLSAMHAQLAEEKASFQAHRESVKSIGTGKEEVNQTLQHRLTATIQQVICLWITGRSHHIF